MEYFKICMNRNPWKYKFSVPQLSFIQFWWNLHRMLLELLTSMQNLKTVAPKLWKILSAVLSTQSTEAIKPTVPNIQYCFARRNSHFICLYVIHYCNTFLINKKVYFRITEHNYHPKKHKLHNNKLLFLWNSNCINF